MRATLLLVVVVVSTLSVMEAHADGLLKATDGGAVTAPLATKLDIRIKAQVATTITTMGFIAQSNGAQQVLFPLPEDATAVGFAVMHDGEWVEATIEKKIAEDTSSTGDYFMDATLEAYLGGNSLAVSIGDWHEGDAIKVRLEYIEILPYDFGEVTYRYPLASGSYAPDAGVMMTFDLELSTPRPLVGWYSSPYTMDVESDASGSKDLHVWGSTDPGVSKSDLTFTYSEEQDGIFGYLLTHHESCDEDGFFLLILEPMANVDEGDVIPKVFQFVFDTSGSMSGYKMSQAKEAAQYSIERLGDKDRFNVIAFDDYVDTLFQSPQDATGQTKASGISFIKSQNAGGSTNIYGALSEALQTPVESSYARIIIFLTDGNPTAGEYTNSGAIRSHIEALNDDEIRIYSFGVGDDVDQQFLTALSAENHGNAYFLDGGGDIFGTIATFFETINKPVLTDIALDYGSITTSDVYPGELTDLFAGTQLMVVGRYDGGGTTTVTLEGNLKGEEQEVSFPMAFPECSSEAHDFIPRVWAKAKIDALFTSIATEGDDGSKKAEIIALAEKYGIQTTYTSFSAYQEPDTSSSGDDYDYDDGYDYSSDDDGWWGGWSTGGDEPDGNGGLIIIGLLCFLMGLGIVARPNRARDETGS